MFLPVEQEMENRGIAYEKKIRIINGSKFYVDYMMKDRFKTPSINDVFPKLSVWNSYDGVLKFRREFGFHKLICSNGLTRPMKNIQSIVSKHSMGITDEESISLLVNDTVVDTISFLKDIEKDMDIFEIMNNKEANGRILTSLAKKAGLSKKIVEVAKERFQLETKGGSKYINEYGELVEHSGSPATLFTVYNALNYGIYNTNEKELPEKKIERDKKLLIATMS